MSESVWARLRRYAIGGAWPDLIIEAADRGKALDLEISLRQKQTIRDALERERAKRRIEELERALRQIAEGEPNGSWAREEARAVLKKEISR